MVVGSASALLGGATVTGAERFTVVIDPDTAVEEIVDVSAVATNTLTIVRGIDNAGTGQVHSAGAVVRHMAIGRDYRESNLHIEASAAYNDGTATHDLHGIASGEGDVVGTGKTQTLTNKTLTSPVISGLSISDGSIVIEGATDDAFETTLTFTDPTADRTITFKNESGTVAYTADITSALTTYTRKYSANVGNASATSISVTHSLSTRDVQVQVYDNATYDTVEVDVVRTDADTVTVSFATAPALNAYRVVVIG
jgi:hypothetical protein